MYTKKVNKQSETINILLKTKRLTYELQSKKKKQKINTEKKIDIGLILNYHNTVYKLPKSKYKQCWKNKKNNIFPNKFKTKNFKTADCGFYKILKY